MLSIFDKNVAEIVRVLVTFADSQLPTVLEAIKDSGVPCPQSEDGLPLHFKFNNSALFADNKSSAAGVKMEALIRYFGTWEQEAWRRSLML